MSDLPLSLQDRYTPKTRKNNLYSDFLVNLDFHPDNNQLLANKDIAAVNRSIKNLLFTNKYERLFNPRLGSNLKAVLFENISASTSDDLKKFISETIKTYEPRVNLHSVEVKIFPDQNGYVATITYSIKNISTPVVLNLPLIRDR